MREVAERYDEVFEGILVKVNDDAVATVAVARGWRGRGVDTVVVKTPLYNTACGLGFQEGDRYLLFARNAGAELYADSCGPSRRWDDEAERLAELLDRGHPVP